MSYVECGTANARAGSKAWGRIRVREGHKRVDIPVCVVNGAREGEHVVVIANQHGSEINGVESARRAAEAIDPASLKGTVFILPSVNPRAAMFGGRWWPEDEKGSKPFAGGKQMSARMEAQRKKYNMSPLWPGAKGVRLANRIVYEVWNRAVMAPHRKASLFLDVHGASGRSFAFASQPWNVDLGVATGLGVVITSHSRLDRNNSHKVGFEAGIASMCIELNGQHVMDPVSIEDGRRAILNLLKFWGMLAGRPEYPEMTLIMDPWRNDVHKERRYKNPSLVSVKAARAGLLVPRHVAHDWVSKGELVCYVVDPFSGQVVQECRAPMAGGIYSMRTMQGSGYVCEKGSDLFAVGLGRRVRTAEYVRRLDSERLRSLPYAEYVQQAQAREP